MDHTVATHLIKDTFTQSFDENRFRNFAINLLNKIDESKAFPPIQGQYIKDAFKKHIKQYKRIGTYTDPDGLKIDVMIVYLHRESALDHARTMQRNFMVDYLKNRDQKDAALVAYIGEDKSDWRFSLVRMEYKTIQTESGKVKVKEDFTPARRYSFLVGKNEPNHTAQVQLLPILEDTQKNPTLDKLETAFNIESVTKEFFEKYKELFLQLKEELDNIATNNGTIQTEFIRCEIDTAAFAKKLLGQIVFLYFLQRKGWMGVQEGNNWGSGSKDFLFNLFEKKYGNYQNFFHDMLEPLFYQALAVEREDNLYTPLNCRIPFLNGGLFEPLGSYDWQRFDIPITNNFFRTVFETFNLYNFTVREDEPLEREVAVDPEMLGKVFENLLEVKDRKSKGAFYTPREIVHYMCQESLINYLDSALNQSEEKIVQVNPSQGYLFGALAPSQKSLTTEVYVPIVPREDIEVFIRHGDVAADFDAAKETGTKSYDWLLKESIRKHAKEIDDGLADIKVCDPAIGSGAFPVGIMSEIIKARGVLSKYLPKDVVRTAYAFKRHAIENSIYGVDIDSSAVDIARLRLWLSLVVEEEDFQSIKPLPNLDYKIVCGNSLSGFPNNWGSPIEKEIETLIHLHINETNSHRKKELKKKIDNKLEIRYKNSLKTFGYKVDFDFRAVFSEVFHQKGGFDVIIGNPPYISHDKITDKLSLKTNFKCFEPFADIYCYFLEKAVILQNPNGLVCFITSNSYLRAKYGDPIRKFLCTQNFLLQLINIETSQIFESAIVNIAILIGSRASIFIEKTCRIVNSEIVGNDFVRFIDENSYEYEQSYFRTKSWTLARPQLVKLLKKIESNGRSLESFGTKIRLGLATGANEAFVIDECQRNEFINRSPKNAFLIKPILRGRDIQRYGYDFPQLYILLIKNGVNLRKDYPDIFEYLNSFGDTFKKRGAKGQYWWNLRACSFFEDFSLEKIIWIELADIGRFALCKDEVYLLNSAYFLLPPKELDTEYLLGILNSKVIRFFLNGIAETSGMGTNRWINNHVKEFPIPMISKIDQKPIVDLVNRVIELKKTDTHRNTIDLEIEIDRKIFNLFKLTSDEITILEETLK